VTASELASIQLPGKHEGEKVRLGDLHDAAALRFLARCLHDLDPDVLGPPLNGTWLNGFDLVMVATGVHCPVLLVACEPECGGMLPQEDTGALASALPDCSKIVMPGIGHLMHWQATEATLRLLHAFLASL
jgi:pimeloyl-ACP methyl ester carboxylesterase